MQARLVNQAQRVNIRLGVERTAVEWLVTHRRGRRVLGSRNQSSPVPQLRVVADMTRR